jgi:FAD/FMN-containing dehydrogenase
VKETAWAVVESPRQAVDLLAKAKAASGGAVTGFEIVSSFALGLVLKHIPDTRDPLPAKAGWRVLIELSLPRAEGARDMMEGLLADAAEAGLIADAVVADSEAQRAMLWKIRESISLAERTHGKALKHDVSVPVSRVAELIQRGTELVKELYPAADVIALGMWATGISTST